MTPREELLQIAKPTDLVKGILGGSVTMASWLTSHLPDIEAWLRITSLFVGIGVGIATIVSIRRKK